MDLIVWVAFGAVIGMLANGATASTAGSGVWLSVAAGVVGAMLGGGFLAPLVGFGETRDAALHVPALLLAMVAATVLVAIVHVLRRESLR